MGELLAVGEDLEDVVLGHGDEAPQVEHSDAGPPPAQAHQFHAAHAELGSLDCAQQDQWFVEPELGATLGTALGDGVVLLEVGTVQGEALGGRVVETGVEIEGKGFETGTEVGEVVGYVGRYQVLHGQGVSGVVVHFLFKTM